MHELAVAMELVELATAEALRQGDVRVTAVHLRLGPLSGVVEDALVFSFEVAAAGTALEGARLHIEREAVVAWCAACSRARTLTTMQHRCCPVCEEPTAELMAGDALELTALEVLDDVGPNS